MSLRFRLSGAKPVREFKHIIRCLAAIGALVFLFEQASSARASDALPTRARRTPPSPSGLLRLSLGHNNNKLTTHPPPPPKNQIPTNNTGPELLVEAVPERVSCGRAFPSAKAKPPPPSQRTARAL